MRLKQGKKYGLAAIGDDSDKNNDTCTYGTHRDMPVRFRCDLATITK